MERDLILFRNILLNSKRFHIKLGFWNFVLSPFFQSKFIHRSVRVFILRSFGAKVGKHVVIKPKVKIHFPWNLIIGNQSWIGEEVWFINHEEISIGANVCVSQRTILSSGGHDYKSISLEYKHAPIKIEDGAWLCLDSKVLPGVTIGEGSVIAAGEIVRNDIPKLSMLQDGKLRRIESPSRP